MKHISTLKININFECLGCKKTEQCGILEAIENGAPMCTDCDDVMEIVDCELDIMEA